jgi:AraC family transcriptional regulator
LGSGVRRFGLYPLPVQQRGNWEFFAVVRGACGAVTPDVDKPVMQRRRLWVFPPDSRHGWVGDGAKQCQVAVFHFGAVRPVLERMVRARGWLERALTAREARCVAALEKELRPFHRDVTERSLLIFEKAMLELSLLALEGLPLDRMESKSEVALRRVESSLAWYGEHMTERPGVEHVAKAAHMSVSHLRRLFWETRRESPQRAFTTLRLQRAMELLTQSALKLDAIAAQCGFSSASDFCRVFQARHGIGPDRWRESQYPPYREHEKDRVRR